MVGVEIVFRPLAHGDLPLLQRWRAEPHVARWWGDDYSIAEVEAEFGPVIDTTEPSEGHIVVCDGAPIGFVQRYLLSDYPDWIRTLEPAGDFSAAAGIDYLIGESTSIGRGIGTAVVAAYVASTFVRYPQARGIVTDVDQRNVASWRVLEKNGFVRVWAGQLDAKDPWDRTPCYVYALERGLR
jgi:aminoglycoside 6'-N-acetyltransferase